MVLLITSDKGLCGAYNTNAIQNTVKFLKENSDKEITLHLMGKKGNIFFQNRPYTIGEFYAETVEEIGLTSLKAGDHKVSEIATKMIEDFEGGNYDEIHLFYTKFKTVMKSDPARVRLLPLENIDADAGDAEGKKAPQGDCILEPSSEAIFSKLLPKYLECQLRQAIFESLTAEYAARRMAMIAASENAEEIIGDLTQVYNKARQEAITKELLEVVSGSEAMAG
jgi:F-type H+-transporting ATPase subunit gamma